MVSIHTFELTKEVDKDTFYKWRNKVKNRKKYSKEKFKDYTLAKYGITVWYPQTEFKKKIKLIVNPSSLLGYDDLIKLWEPNKKNIIKLFNLLEENINDYFNFKYNLNDFKLTRMDFTKNIQLGDRDKVAAYIKLLYNIRQVKGFSPKYEKGDDWYDKNRSFDLEGNSNGIEFTVYDKEAAIKQKEKDDEMEFKRKERETRIEKAKGILRIEVKLTTQKAIRKYVDDEDTIKRIANLFNQSENIFFDTFARVIPFGDFYKKDKAVKIIEGNVTEKKLKKKMLKLLELIPKKKSLYLAVKEFNDRNIDRILNEFHNLELSPVTISKRHKIKHLKNLYTFF